MDTDGQQSSSEAQSLRWHAAHRSASGRRLHTGGGSVALDKGDLSPVKVVHRNLLSCARQAILEAQRLANGDVAELAVDSRSSSPLSAPRSSVAPRLVSQPSDSTQGTFAATEAVKLPQGAQGDTAVTLEGLQQLTEKHTVNGHLPASQQFTQQPGDQHRQSLSKSTTHTQPAMLMSGMPTDASTCFSTKAQQPPKELLQLVDMISSYARPALLNPDGRNRTWAPSAPQTNSTNSNTVANGGAVSMPMLPQAQPQHVTSPPVVIASTAAPADAHANQLNQTSVTSRCMAATEVSELIQRYDSSSADIGISGPNCNPATSHVAESCAQPHISASQAVAHAVRQDIDLLSLPQPLPIQTTASSLSASGVATHNSAAASILGSRHLLKNWLQQRAKGQAEDPQLPDGLHEWSAPIGSIALATVPPASETTGDAQPDSFDGTSKPYVIPATQPAMATQAVDPANLATAVMPQPFVKDGRVMELGADSATTTTGVAAAAAAAAAEAAALPVMAPPGGAVSRLKRGGTSGDGAPFNQARIGLAFWLCPGCRVVKPASEFPLKGHNAARMLPQCGDCGGSSRRRNRSRPPQQKRKALPAAVSAEPSNIMAVSTEPSSTTAAPDIAAEPPKASVSSEASSLTSTGSFLDGSGGGSGLLDNVITHRLMSQPEEQPQWGAKRRRCNTIIPIPATAPALCAPQPVASGNLPAVVTNLHVSAVPTAVDVSTSGPTIMTSSPARVLPAHPASPALDVVPLHSASGGAATGNTTNLLEPGGGLQRWLANTAAAASAAARAPVLKAMPD